MHPDPHLAALAAQGWRIAHGHDQRGRPYVWAERGGYVRGSHRPDLLAEMCGEVPAGAPRGTRESMEPYYDHNGITIYHGDCREVLPHIHPFGACVVSDVPYGRALRSGWNGAHGDCEIANDGDTVVRDFIVAWVAAAGRPAIIFGSPAVPRPDGVTHDRVLIWDKGEHVGMGDLSWPWKPNYEEIYVLGEGFAGRRTGSVLHYNAIAGTVATSQGRTHPAEKPVSLMQALVSKCPPEWVIIDPAMGTGATLVAARNLGRRAIGIELERAYCDAAIARLRQTAMVFEETAA